MPQRICLLNNQGHIIHTNRTIERVEAYLMRRQAYPWLPRHGEESKTASAWDTLTHREREVLKRRGGSLPLPKHRSNLMKKLDLHNASMLTSYAIETGLVS